MAYEVADIAERFEVVEQAAKGGMGVVYKTRDRQTGAFVAVKLLRRVDRESELRFEREASILATLTHPAIVGYVAHGTAKDGRPYLAMEWVDGETLHARLSRTGLTIAESIELGRRVAEALGYAHERGIVHRDVKPTNIILRERDLSRLAILDFGVARAPTSGSLTSTGALVGTPAYMAPEQARGERELGPSVDVFALGCVLYECITGRRAFEGKHVLALLAKVVLWDPPRPGANDPSVPAALDAAIAKMLAKDRALRPKDGNEAAALLATIEPPTGPKRRGARSQPTATAIVRGDAPTLATPIGDARLASIVVATPPGAADEAEAVPETSWPPQTELVEALERRGVRFERLHDGSILAAITGDQPKDLVDNAIACARELRHIAPDAMIAVATGEIGKGDALVAVIGPMLENTVGALAREAMTVLFADVAQSARPVGAIRIDERTARMLPAGTVVRVKSTCYVRPEDSR